MNKITYKFNEENNKVLEFRKVVVHKIKIIGHSPDPDVEIAATLHEWQQTSAGQFVMKNAIDINWTYYLEFNSYSYVYYVVATMEAKKTNRILLKI